eukprot:6208564-Pleurochrysis_carterae.AAC.10
MLALGPRCRHAVEVAGTAGVRASCPAHVHASCPAHDAALFESAVCGRSERQANMVVRDVAQCKARRRGSRKFHADASSITDCALAWVGRGTAVRMLLYGKRSLLLLVDIELHPRASQAQAEDAAELTFWLIQRQQVSAELAACWTRALCLPCRFVVALAHSSPRTALFCLP